jgi:hypothetical protein
MSNWKKIFSFSEPNSIVILEYCLDDDDSIENHKINNLIARCKNITKFTCKIEDENDEFDEFVRKSDVFLHVKELISLFQLMIA